MQEVCGAGWHVGCRPFWTGQGSWQAVADVEDILEALERRYCLSNSETKKLSEKARRHALGYAVPKVLEEYMLPALETARERFAERDPDEIKTQVAA
jgi:hypothetical protein